MPVIRDRETARPIEEIIAEQVMSVDMALGRPTTHRDPLRVYIPEEERGLYFFSWVDAESADRVFEQGGELVPVEENGVNNLEKYRLARRAGASGKWISKRGLLLARTPMKIVEAQAVYDLMATYNSLGYNIGKLNEDADAANKRDHKGKLTKGLAETPRVYNHPIEARLDAIKNRTKSNRTRIEDKIDEQISNMESNRMDDVLEMQGLTHEDLETGEGED